MIDFSLSGSTYDVYCNGVPTISLRSLAVMTFSASYRQALTGVIFGRTSTKRDAAQKLQVFHAQPANVAFCQPYRGDITAPYFSTYKFTLL